MLSFVCISPHAPILLPDVGTSADRLKVKSTIGSLERLGENLAKVSPEQIIISSPHPDWGFNVPLHFLAKDLKNKKIKPYLTDFESPAVHFERGKKIGAGLPKNEKVAWIASGDMSHKLKEDGPYGLHPSGPEFDRKFIELLKAKDVAGILHLDERLVEEAGECGLRSFCMLLGALEAHSASSGQAWNPEILSYEGPFGVGYLVADFKLEKNEKRLLH